MAQLNLSRCYYLLRYHRKSQMALRAWKIMRRALQRWTGGAYDRRLLENLPARRENPGFGLLAEEKCAARQACGAGERAAGILDGCFEFVNQAKILADPIDWRVSGFQEVPHLWRFHLHSHDFLLDLAAADGQDGDGQPGGGQARRRAWDIVRQWIENNPLSDSRGLRDAWHPHCISRRLPVWLLLWSSGGPPAEIERMAAESLAMQTSFLERHLEWDLGGSHLLENAKALAMAGAFFDGPAAERWLDTGQRILRDELPRQTLPHGEHFERAPGYHLQVLEAVLDVRDTVRAIRPELAARCAEEAARMAAFAEAVVHPDGEIPLLGDSCLGEMRLDRLLPRVGRGQAAAATVAPPVGERSDCPLPTAAAGQNGKPFSSQTVGDYWVHRDGDDFLLFDAGPVGPDHLPAHAHADLLGLEASIQGRRLFVDSGVFNYEDDEMRQYCRSSAAHNVLQIDFVDQCDMWSRFRMGYRGWPSGFATGQTHGFAWARAEHNAFRRVGVPKVGRWIACRPGGPWLCVDWAISRETHILVNRLCLHPDVQVEQTSGDRVDLRCGDVELEVRFLSRGEITLSSGWYCPRCGHRQRSPVILWTATTSLPAVCGWSLARKGREGRATLGPWASSETRLCWAESGKEVALHPLR